MTDSRYPKRGELSEDGYVIYEQAFGEDTAIRYKPTFNGYKEDIILYNGNAPTSYSFEIKCDNLYILKENGAMNFYSEFTDKIMFSTDPYYIYDSSDKVNSYTDTEYTVVKTGDNEYLLTISISEDFLNTEGLTYPVYVDPTVYHSYNYEVDKNATVEDAPLYSGQPNTAHASIPEAELGLTTNKGVGRMLLRFPNIENIFSTYKLNPTKIHRADLYLYNIASGSVSATVSIKQFDGISTWAEQSATWSNVGSYSLNGIGTSGILSYSQTKYISYNVTNILEGWFNSDNKPNENAIKQGMIIKLDNESNSSYIKTVSTSEDTTYYGTPYLVITYSDFLEDGIFYFQSRANKNLFIDYITPNGDAVVKVGSFDVSKSRYEIELEADGYYSIQSMSSGRYIGVTGGSSSEGAKIVNYYNYDTTDGTKWILDRKSRGEGFTFSAKCGNGKFLCFDPATNELIQSLNADYSGWNLYPAQGENIGNLTYWDVIDYDDDGEEIPQNDIGCWIYNPKVYVNINDTPSFSKLNEYVTNAVNQWNAMLKTNIQVVTNESQADIIVYGRKEEDFYHVYPDRYGTTNYGVDNALTYAYANYNGTLKTVWFLKKITIDIPNDTSRSENDMQTTVTHEMGHALGFKGHSEYVEDMMYRSANPNGISLNDRAHLVQIYELIEE